MTPNGTARPDGRAEEGPVDIDSIDLILIIVVLVVLAAGAAVSLARNFHEHRSIQHYSDAMGRLRDLGRQYGVDRDGVDRDGVDRDGVDRYDRKRRAAGRPGRPGPPAPDRLVATPRAEVGRPASDPGPGHPIRTGQHAPPEGALRLARVDLPSAVGGPPKLARPAPAHAARPDQPPAGHVRRGAPPEPVDLSDADQPPPAASGPA